LSGLVLWEIVWECNRIGDSGTLRRAIARHESTQDNRVPCRFGNAALPTVSRRGDSRIAPTGHGGTPGTAEALDFIGQPAAVAGWRQTSTRDCRTAGSPVQTATSPPAIRPSTFAIGSICSPGTPRPSRTFRGRPSCSQRTRHRSPSSSTASAAQEDTSSCSSGDMLKSPPCKRAVELT